MSYYPCEHLLVEYVIAEGPYHQNIRHVDGMLSGKLVDKDTETEQGLPESTKASPKIHLLIAFLI